jgi:hypothetical protein
LKFIQIDQEVKIQNYHLYNHSLQRGNEPPDASNPDLFLKKFSVCSSTMYQAKNKRPYVTCLESESQRMSSSVSSNNESDSLRFAKQPPHHVNPTKLFRSSTVNTNNASVEQPEATLRGK